MSRILLLLPLVLLSSCAVTKRSSGTGPLNTEDKVDVRKYSGKWYEIARFPNIFQRGCVSATAEYSVKPDGSIRVVNTCIRADGSTRSITGSARPVDASANRLKVTFSDSLYAKFIPVPDEGNYWIIHVGQGYRHAIVGTPDRKSLWLLSRSSSISSGEIERLKRIAADEGFDIGKLVVDSHTDITGR